MSMPDQRADLEQSLSELIAERDIRAVIDDYCHAMDFERPDQWVACFAPDGLFEVLLPNGEPFVRAEGETELRAFVEGMMGRPGLHKHVYASSRISLGPNCDEGSATSYFFMLSAESGQVGVTSFGRTKDHFVRTAGRWLIRQRRLVTEAYSPLAGTGEA